MQMDIFVEFAHLRLIFVSILAERFFWQNQKTRIITNHA